MSTPRTSVVYVALGGRRTGAARRVSADPAAGGTGVRIRALPVRIRVLPVRGKARA